VITTIALVAALTISQVDYAANADVQDYAYIIEQAENCKYSKGKTIDPSLLIGLARIEKSYNPPPELKGMLLAAACHESGFNPDALGDWRSVIRRGRKVRVARAVGLFQMWSWWETGKYGYGIDRRNPLEAAEAFMIHIMTQLPKVRKRCKYRTNHRQWIAAWVHAIRAPKEGGRCNQKPLHLRFLKRWHKNIERTYGC
jgi:hypothetical protein|tara:strand:+ start:1859 stop:2455 length:597 start_codon:yes stop_codon:yes gene_type:complete